MYVHQVYVCLMTAVIGGAGGSKGVVTDRSDALLDVNVLDPFFHGIIGAKIAVPV